MLAKRIGATDTADNIRSDPAKLRAIRAPRQSKTNPFFQQIGDGWTGSGDDLDRGGGGVAQQDRQGQVVESVIKVGYFWLCRR